MTTLFTRIIDGELPGRFVWKDSDAVAFLTIAPLRTGHTLVVPRLPVDHWLDAPAVLRHHLMDVAAHVGEALMMVYRPQKVGLMLAGLEIPHLHLHVVPIDDVHDLDFSRADSTVSAESLDTAHTAIVAALRTLGHAGPD